MLLGPELVDGLKDQDKEEPVGLAAATMLPGWFDRVLPRVSVGFPAPAVTSKSEALPLGWPRAGSGDGATVPLDVPGGVGCVGDDGLHAEQRAAA